MGISVSSNHITNDVLALIDATTVEAGGDVELSASSDSTIESFSVAGSGSVSAGDGGLAFGGAGAISDNDVENTVEASASDTTITAGGLLSVVASDSSSIEANAGGLSVSVAAGGTASVSVGAAVALNDIANTVRAALDTVDATAPTGVTVTATSSATMTVITIGLAAAVTTGSSGSISVVGAGSGSGNDIANTTTAEIVASTVDTSGPVTVSATDSSSIFAVAGAASVAAGGGSGGAANFAVGASLAFNGIENESSRGSTPRRSAAAARRPAGSP